MPGHYGKMKVKKKANGMKKKYKGFSKIIFAEKILISGPPIIKTTTRDVITDSPVLKVRYLNTFRKE